MHRSYKVGRRGHSCRSAPAPCIIYHGCYKQALLADEEKWIARLGTLVFREEMLTEMHFVPIAVGFGGKHFYFVSISQT